MGALDDLIARPSDKKGALDALMEKSEDSPKIKTRGLFGSSIGEDTKTMSKLRIPEEAIRASGKYVSGKTMDMIEPEFKNEYLNMAARLPQTVSAIGQEAVSEFGAGMVSPESVAVGGTLKGIKFAKPAIKAVGRAIGSGAEKLSGLTYKNAGVLSEVTKNPMLPFRPGSEAANETYARMVDPTQIRESLKTVLGKKEFVEEAIKAAQAGTLTADEALIARQGLDQIKNTVPRPVFFNVRDMLDSIAKTKFKSADIARTIASKADALRNIFPLNKGGTPSRLGQVVQGAALSGGYGVNPAIALTAPVISPYGQALAASAVGVTRKAASPFINNPKVSMATAALIEKLRKNAKEKK